MPSKLSDCIEQDPDSRPNEVHGMVVNIKYMALEFLDVSKIMA